MARIRNPLFSLSASGSINDLTFNLQTGAVTYNHNARRKPRAPSGPRSTPQQDRNQRFANASKAWLSLDPGTKSFWENHGITRTKYGYRWFVAEYIEQQIVPPNLPQQPVPTYTL